MEIVNQGGALSQNLTIVGAKRRRLSWINLVVLDERQRLPDLPSTTDLGEMRERVRSVP